MFRSAGLSSAFYVGSNKPQIASNTSSIVFDKSVTNNMYNNNTPVTSVLENAVYWFQLAAGVPRHTPSNTRLNGLPYPLVVHTSTTNYPDNVIVTDTIQNVSTSAQLTVSNTDLVFGTINDYMGTSVLGFRLDNIMSEHVYFSVQLTHSVANNKPGTNSVLAI
jgi:hypothetical protein